MKTRLFIHFILSFILTSIFILISRWLTKREENLFTLDTWKTLNIFEIEIFYKNNLRGNLFAGLISISALLMTGMTFILITMKNNIFDSKEYIENFKKLQKHNSTLTHYGPLKELKDLLYYSVFVSFLAAIFQFTIGLIPNYICTILSIFIAIYSIVLVFDSLRMIKINLDFWLNNHK